MIDTHVTCPKCGIVYVDNCSWAHEMYTLCYTTQNGCWEVFENFSIGRGHAWADRQKAYVEFLGFARWVKEVREEATVGG